MQVRHEGYVRTLITVPASRVNAHTRKLRVFDYMTPNFTIRNHAYSRNAYCKFTRNGNQGMSIFSHISNLHGLFFSNFVHAMFGALIFLVPKYSVRMQSVFTASYIFEIAKSAIGSVPIFMIYFFAFGWRSSKCQYHKSMNLKMLWFTIFPQIYSKITFYNFWLHDFGCAVLFAGFRQQRSYYPQITNFIPSFIFRYRFPCFNYHGTKYSTCVT